MTQTNTYVNENGLRKFFSKTFSIVALGTIISAVLAYVGSKYVEGFIASHPGVSLGLILGVIVAELALAIIFSSRLMKMSKGAAWFCFIAYSVLTGLSFTVIVSTYNLGSVALAFAATTIMFICMSVIGYTSKIDFTKVYSLLLPLFIAGLVISLLNVFLFKQPWLDLLITYIGLILFLALTAADIQKLSNYYYASMSSAELADKLMILSAFQLYLDFVNLFIRILEIIGKRKRD